MRIVIADDSALLRAGLGRLLGDAGHEVVAAVGSAPELLAAVDRTAPDLVVTDVRMPPRFEEDGARAAEQLRIAHPGLPIVLVSQHVVAGPVLGLVSQGGFGYLLKDRVLDEADFLDALERVARGGSALDPEVVAALVRPGSQDAPVAALTARERGVLALMAEGRSNPAIAAELVLSHRTVETHVRAIFTKLGLDADADSDRRVLAVLAHLRAGA